MKQTRYMLLRGRPQPKMNCRKGRRELQDGGLRLCRSLTGLNQPSTESQATGELSVSGRRVFGEFMILLQASLPDSFRVAAGLFAGAHGIGFVLSKEGGDEDGGAQCSWLIHSAR